MGDNLKQSSGDFFSISTEKAFSEVISEGKHEISFESELLLKDKIYNGSRYNISFSMEKIFWKEKERDKKSDIVKHFKVIKW